MTHDDRPILVLPATGKTGRRVAARLRARGVAVRPGSRGATPPFDWEDRSTWAGALEGARAAYVAYYPDIAAPGAVEQVGAFTALAVERGVTRLVLLSGRGEPEAEEAERAAAAAASGAELTIVRANWFAQNFSEDYMLEHVLAGEVRLPAGDTPEPFSDVEDIADIAAAALTEDGHAGELYEVSGARALTFAEAIAEIGRAAGRDVRYVPVTLEEHAAEAAAHGVPEEVIELLTYLFGTILDGRNSSVTDGVQRALGRPPRDFSAFARDAAATGVWTPAASAAA